MAYKKYKHGGPHDPNLAKVKKGLKYVESSNGLQMTNPNSSATGFYGQLYNAEELQYMSYLDGVNRQSFASDTTLQNKLFEDRYYGNIPKVPGLKGNAEDLRIEYQPQLAKKGIPFNYTDDEISALSNLLGRQGTREYLGYVLRDGRSLADVFPKIYGPDPEAPNKTPEKYLESYREGRDLKYGGQVRSYQNGGPTDPPTNPYADLYSAPDNTQVNNNAILNASFQTPEGMNWNPATRKLQNNWDGSPQSGKISSDNIIPELMFPFGKTLNLGANAIKTLKAVKKSKTIAPEYLKDIQRFTGNPDATLKNATYSKSLNISEDMALMDKNAANLYSEAIENSVDLISNTVKKKAAEIATPEGQKRLISLYVENGMPYKAAAAKAKARAKEMSKISIDNVTETSKWRNPPDYGPSQKPYEHRGRLFPGTSSYTPAKGTSPESVGIGLDMLTNTPSMRHELTHALQEGLVTSLDKTLSKLTPRKNLSGAAKDAYTYFTKGGSNSAYPIEASPFLAELRATLIEKGFMKYTGDGYFKNMSSKNLKKAYKELSNNPSHRIIDKVSPISGESERLVSSSQRIFDFMDPTKANFKLLAESFNKLPTTVGAAALGTEMYNKNTNSGDAPESYKYGGNMKKYKNGGDPPKKKPAQLQFDPTSMFNPYGDPTYSLEEYNTAITRDSTNLEEALSPGLIAQMFGMDEAILPSDYADKLGRKLLTNRVNRNILKPYSEKELQDINYRKYGGKAMFGGNPTSSVSPMIDKILQASMEAMIPNNIKNNSESFNYSDLRNVMPVLHSSDRMENGGKSMDVDYEAEGGEVVIGNIAVNKAYNGGIARQYKGSNMFKLEGPSHANGGIGITMQTGGKAGMNYMRMGGNNETSYVFSDAIGKKGNTFADRASKFGNKLDNINTMGMGGEISDRNTAERMGPRLMSKVKDLFNEQEDFKVKNNIDQDPDRMFLGGLAAKFGATALGKLGASAGLTPGLTAAQFLPGAVNVAKGLFGKAPEMNLERVVPEMQEYEDFTGLQDTYMNQQDRSLYGLRKGLEGSGATGSQIRGNLQAGLSSSQNNAGQFFSQVGQMQSQSNRQTDNLNYQRGIQADQMNSQMDAMEDQFAMQNDPTQAFSQGLSQLIGTGTGMAKEGFNRKMMEQMFGAMGGGNSPTSNSPTFTPNSGYMGESPGLGLDASLLGNTSLFGRFGGRMSRSKRLK